MTINEFIEKYNPCGEAVEWLLTQPDIQAAWENCNRPDWMFFALSKIRPLTEQQNAAISVAMVRETPLHDGRFVVDLLTDDRSLTFLRMKEKWGSSPEGTSKPEGWDAASDAAWAAVWAAVWAAADDAAWAAADAAQANIIRRFIPRIEP